MENTKSEAGPPRCPDCNRPEAATFHDVLDGMCPRKWAVRDTDAIRDCRDAAEAAKVMREFKCTRETRGKALAALGDHADRLWLDGISKLRLSRREASSGRKQAAQVFSGEADLLCAQALLLWEFLKTFAEGS